MSAILDSINKYRTQGHGQSQRRPPEMVNSTQYTYAEMPSTAMEVEAIAALVAAAHHPAPIIADDETHSPGHHLAIPRTPAVSNNARVTNNSLSAHMMFDGQADIPIDPGLTTLESEQAAHLVTTAAVPSSEGVEVAAIPQSEQRKVDGQDGTSSKSSFWHLMLAPQIRQHIRYKTIGHLSTVCCLPYSPLHRRTFHTLI